MRAFFASVSLCLAACLLLGACATAGLAPAPGGHLHHRHQVRPREHAFVTIGPASAVEVQRDVTSAAVAAGVPPAIAHAVARQESDENPRARGGIMQVLPNTAREFGEDAKSYLGQLRAGMKFLRAQLDRRGLTLCEKISAYNRGAFAKPACTRYGRAVLKRAGQ